MRSWESCDGPISAWAAPDGHKPRPSQSTRPSDSPAAFDGKVPANRCSAWRPPLLLPLFFVSPATRETPWKGLASPKSTEELIVKPKREELSLKRTDGSATRMEREPNVVSSGPGAVTVLDILRDGLEVAVKPWRDGFEDGVVLPDGDGVLLQVVPKVSPTVKCGSRFV
mmetsp:Transcript_121965/g.352331  ORF Transcript_121965/g.352331 Transcript_121965/m.352331 type:complete len:169 (-) Transcript_121965:155-661(-)